MATLPTLFISHGSPMVALDSGEAGCAWAKLGRELPRPQSILSVSAHWNTRDPVVSAAPTNDTIHDFHGFPEALYRVRYPAPGAPDLAARVADLLEAAKMPIGIDPERGLDHGAYVPLMNMFPDADIPVAQLSVQPQRDARWHMKIGRALAKLRDEGVLIVASGGAVHNLREMARDGGDTPDWARNFDDWLARTLAAGNEADFLDWDKKGPEAKRAQPTPEHFLPIFVAYGAAGDHPQATPLFKGFTLGSMSMAAYGFAAGSAAADFAA
ncbi:MAG TPA: 4,5-DOPA dioxygenase extradiol [Stellaceae bacterium]|nr:4,5-DOPA dioxygenase extradiol [Stellaceae bacterium]